jgi:enoyl-CoA hydratase
VRAYIDQGVGHIELDRPEAINALTLEMIRELTRILDDYAADDQIKSVELRGLGERGFCAGADVRQLRDMVLAGEDPGVFFEAEYSLDRKVLTYPKAHTTHIHGITMGGGMGISVHSGTRVVSPDAKLAMPETKIGLFPDVLMSWHLAWMPFEIGTHLGLTGNSFNAADALWLKLADSCDGEPPVGALAAQSEWIAQCYGGAETVGEIIGRLEQHADPQARQTAADLRARCPLSLAVTLEALRRARAIRTLASQLDQDLSVAKALAVKPDFAEGVRAQLVDRDRQPKWSHERVEDVSRDEVLACFANA